MAAPKSRGQIIMPTESVQLVAQFRDENGAAHDLDAFPKITIIQPSGGVVLGPTSAGVYRLDVGKYGYTWSIGQVGPLGVWSDVWEGTLNTFAVSGQFNFVVFTSQMPMVNTDGYVALGDDPGFNYSQNALNSINKIIKVLKARLKSSGKKRAFDQWGNPIFVDCDIYTIDQLATLAASALTAFNEIPHFTFFTFEDGMIVDQFLDILVQGAVLIALSSQALIERGREFQLNDNGATFTPPTVSELLNTQFGTELANWMEKIKLIKFNMKPAPLGLGTLRALGAAPQWARLRHLRARQIY